MVAAIYMSVPYSIGIENAAALGMGQAFIISYLHKGNAAFIHR